MTASGQMYLKAVYYLCVQSGKTRVAEMAESLSVSRPSVSNALRALAHKGYVTHEPYGDVRLTAKGKTAAQTLILMDERLRKLCFCE